jgi:N-acetylated-alpha-linked acidic dipeptidase
VGEDPARKYTVPLAKPEVPFLDFSPLQNALRQLQNSAVRLNGVFQNNNKMNKVSAAFNNSLYKAEQQLLNENGLPRRAWYKHSVYAPGSYTGYGVKTMPGIREAIEQRNWKEAQEQIETDAKILIKLAEYFNTMITSAS